MTDKKHDQWTHALIDAGREINNVAVYYHVKHFIRNQDADPLH